MNKNLSVLPVRCRVVCEREREAETLSFSICCKNRRRASVLGKQKTQNVGCSCGCERRSLFKKVSRDGAEEVNQC